MSDPLVPDRSRVVLKAFKRVASRWGLSFDESAILLAMDPQDLAASDDPSHTPHLTEAQMTRASYVLGIFDTLHIVFGNAAFADEWVRRPNTDFGARTPLAQMLSQQLEGLASVRDYVERWKGN